jgi:hypothetical protein
MEVDDLAEAFVVDFVGDPCRKCSLQDNCHLFHGDFDDKR